jgi:hypothetical protein
MTYGKDGAVNAVEPSLSQASPPALSANARLLELSEGDNSVLPGRDACDHGIWLGVADFCIHVHA